MKAFAKELKEKLVGSERLAHNNDWTIYQAVP